MPRPLLTATAIIGSLSLIPLATQAMAAVDTDTYREFDQFLDVFNRIKADTSTLALRCSRDQRS